MIERRIILQKHYKSIYLIDSAASSEGGEIFVFFELLLKYVGDHHLSSIISIGIPICIFIEFKCQLSKKAV